MQEVEKLLSPWFAHISDYSADKYPDMSLVSFNWSHHNCANVWNEIFMLKQGFELLSDVENERSKRTE